MSSPSQTTVADTPGQAPLHIRLFGPFTVQIQGAPLPSLRTRKGAWLLALLVLKHDRPLERTWLAETLWPDSVHAQSLKNLRDSLTDLRRALGEQAARLFSPTPGTLSLELADAEVDLLTFDAALRNDGDTAALERAVGLYTGPLLEGCGEEWVAQEREQRQQACLAALERLAGGELAGGKAVQAVSRLRRCVGLDPLRESAQFALLGALAACGDYAGVTEAYRAFRLLLHEELHTQPAAATTALYEQIRVRARQAAAQSATGVLPLIHRKPIDAPADLPPLEELDSPDRGGDPSDLSPPLASSRDSEPQSDTPTAKIPSLPVGTVTFLFTDIEGSTRLWEVYPEAMRSALARHDTLLRRIVVNRGGVVFKTVGDACCAAFSTAPAALQAALAAQQALTSEVWPDSITLKVRMALHTGEAEARDNDYFGPVLNRVARLLSVGHGGQVLLSEATQNLCYESLPPDATLLSLGTHRLRDLMRAETVFQLQHPTLVGEFAPLRTLDHPALPNNLPQQTDSFIGREAAMVEVRALLDRARLLTLTGAGGCGKTRLGLQVATELVERYPDGVWLVELAALSEPALVAHAAARSLAIREQPEQSMLQTLVECLGSKRLLLVLDNCEHLLAPCAEMASLLLRSCPKVQVLATSRERLGIAGEQNYRVPSLSLPDLNMPMSVESVGRYEAVRLFVERACLARSDFRVSPQNAAAVASVCHRLDGIPLALELAAARVRSMSVEDLRRRLDDRFRLLTGGDRTALLRHQTLRALIDWSYNLLTDQERRLLARLSAFAGGWTLETAEQVCSDEPMTAEGIRDWEVLDLLTGLVDKSLTMAVEQDDTVRYHLLETVRQYARERLAESGESDLVQRRHLDHFLTFAETIKPQLERPDANIGIERLDADLENLRAALAYGSSVAGDPEKTTRLATALLTYWQQRGYYREGRSRLEIAAQQDVRLTERTRTEALHAAGSLALLQGDYAAAARLLEACLELRHTQGDTRKTATTLINLGVVLFHLQEDTRASAVLTEAIAIQREHQNWNAVAVALIWLANLAQRRADLEEAQRLLGESLLQYKRIGSTSGYAYVLNSLGMLAHEQGQTERARALYEECLELHRKAANRAEIARALNNFGNALRDLGRLEEAEAALLESLKLWRDLENAAEVALTLITLGMTQCAQNNPEAALNSYFESWSHYQAHEDRKGLIFVLQGVAEVALTTGRTTQAAYLLAQAQRALDERPIELLTSDRRDWQRVLAKAQAALPEGEFMEAWRKGYAMPLGQELPPLQLS